MAAGYLIDTNAFIDYFAALLPPEGMQFIDGLMDAKPVMSVITEIELIIPFAHLILLLSLLFCFAKKEAKESTLLNGSA